MKIFSDNEKEFVSLRTSLKQWLMAIINTGTQKQALLFLKCSGSKETFTLIEWFIPSEDEK